MNARRWQVLIDLVKRNGWQSGAEIGVLACKTTHQLMVNCPQLTLYAVDPLAPQPLTDDSFSDDGTTYAKHDWLSFQHTMQDLLADYQGRLTWMQMLSHEAAPHVPDGSLDFVFIDADHSSPAVEQDIRLWTPKLNPTGWLTGHDAHFPSVRRVIDRMLPGWTQHEDNVWSIPRGSVNL
jgi:hypothetical protein